MEWKKLTIGGVITLLVTILGGVLVYNLTQGDKIKRFETLTFQTENQVSFEGESNNLAIGFIEFANIGNKSANDVKATFYSQSAIIKEFKTENKSGAELMVDISEDKHTVKYL